jgi:maleylacetoacetate isomerase
MLTLYTYYRSTAAYRVRIALNYKQIEHHLVPVNLLEAEQLTEEYVAINPQMRVPTLLDGDFKLGQSLAILEYLEEKYPDLPLLPEDINQRARVRMISQLVASDIHPLNNVGVLKYLKTHFNQEQSAVNRWYYHWIRKGFDALEKLLFDSDRVKKQLFCVGNTVTLADLCLIPQIYNAFRFEFPMGNYPHLLEIYHHCLTLEAFDAARPENQLDAVSIDLSKP